MIQHITKPFKYFFKLEAASGLVLLFAAILALIIAFILLFKWPVVNEKNKKKISLTLLFSTIFLFVTLIALLID